jgi:GNAT superfamily N-acetyltransferase
MIRPCEDADFERVHEIVNDAARAYAGVIPADRYHEPYMPREELRAEIDAGVRFWGWTEEDGPILGIMGIQPRGDVTLVRHAYVLTPDQGRGIGGELLEHLLGTVEGPVLVGTWADAQRAVSFYEKHGFRRTTREETERLLRRYWSIPDRQIETSTVLELAAD